MSRDRGNSVVNNLLPLGRKSREEVPLQTKKVNPVYFYKPQTAIKYQEFNVIKVNKFGVKQDRIMGIDDKRIMNLTANNKVTVTKNEIDWFQEKAKVKRPERMIKDVVRAWVSTQRANQFYVEFKDQTYKYESQSAEEIIAKINFILTMGAQESKDSNKELVAN